MNDVNTAPGSVRGTRGPTSKIVCRSLQFAEGVQWWGFPRRKQGREATFPGLL